LWIEDDSEGNLMIAAKSNDGASRSAYLMVFPNLVYAEVENDFENKVFSKEGIVGEYSNYIGALIEQDAFVATSGLSIMDSYTFRPLYDGAGNAIQAEPYAGEMTENELIEKYGTSNVYTVYSFTLGMSYTQIFVLPNGYTGSNLQATTILNGKNTAWSGISLEPGQNSSGQMGINIYGMNSEANGDEMCITIKNGTEPYAVLLIETRYSD